MVIVSLVTPPIPLVEVEVEVLDELVVLDVLVVLEVLDEPEELEVLIEECEVVEDVGAPVPERK